MIQNELKRGRLLGAPYYALFPRKRKRKKEIINKKAIKHEIEVTFNKLNSVSNANFDVSLSRKFIASHSSSSRSREGKRGVVSRAKQSSKFCLRKPT